MILLLGHGIGSVVTRLRIALITLSLIFAIYGIGQIREALQYETSLRDGIEALCMSAVFIGVLVLVNRLTSRRHDEPIKPP